MPEPQSPLDGIVQAGAYGATSSHEVPLVLSHDLLKSLWQVAGWRDFADAAAPMLAQLGLSGLGDYRTVTGSAAAQCYRVGPDRIWLRDSDIAALEAALALVPTGRLSALDLSQSRLVIRLSGGACVDLLARVATLDFSQPAFPVGMFAQTGIHHVGVLIHRTSEQSFELLVPVTWAASVWDWLCINAEPLGYRVGAGPE